MTTYRDRFGNQHRVFIVIHSRCRQEDDLLNVARAVGGGADGVFLINHSGPGEKLIKIAAEAKAKFPMTFVGVNVLDLDPTQAYKILAQHNGKIEGLWADAGGVYVGPDGAIDYIDAEQYHLEQMNSGWGGFYFGSVAFKTQTPIKNEADLVAVGSTAAKYIDVPTTSGPGTGMAADVKKIKTMKKAVGRSPLAIASGITPENVTDYLPYSDCYLVATGVSKSFYELDENKIIALTAACREYDTQHEVK